MVRLARPIFMLHVGLRFTNNGSCSFLANKPSTVALSAGLIGVGKSRQRIACTVCAVTMVFTGSHWFWFAAASRILNHDFKLFVIQTHRNCSNVGRCVLYTISKDRRLPQSIQLVGKNIDIVGFHHGCFSIVFYRSSIFSYII